MEEYLTANQVEQVTSINTTCLIAYMDAGILPYETHGGIRFIKLSLAKRLKNWHTKLTREFMDYIIDQGMEPRRVLSAVSDREGFLYFCWLTTGNKLPVDEFSKPPHIFVKALAQGDGVEPNVLLG